jgi:hypothetical protein
VLPCNLCTDTFLKTFAVYEYSGISFCDGSFNDDSLLRPLQSRTEHSRLVVHHGRNSSFLSVLSALLPFSGEHVLLLFLFLF